MFTNFDCQNIPSQVRPSSSGSSSSLKRLASEVLSKVEDCACSSESEDDEESRQLRMKFVSFCFKNKTT
uniref:Uncharacterized protein n=1 Tax=Onchocerca volvulus TaxID=6282 RepID=A0A8R1TXB9_ONCVO